LISFIFFYYLRAYIWYRLLQGYKYDIPFKESTFLWGISELKRYTPGNVWAFLGRTVTFGEKGVKKKDMGTLLIIEAEIFVISCLLVSLLAGPFIFSHIMPGVPKPIINSLYGVAIVGTILYIFHNKIKKKLPSRMQTIFAYFFPQLPEKETSFLLGISCISLVFFGASYYFTIASLTVLNPQLAIQIIGIAVLAFVLGYLSLLTPAGFGVREGILIYILTKIMSFNIAGFIALFCRLVLIIAEVVFIGIVMYVQKVNFPVKLKLENWISKNKQLVILILLCAIYTIYFTNISFLRYDNFYTGRFDLGNMAQTVWNTSRGRIFLFTNPNGTEPISRLAFHADFLLILLAPLYYIWANPKMLLLIQTIVLSIGAFFIFFLAKDLLKNKNIALTLSFLYLFNPSIERANLYDFHPVTLSTTFLLATFYFYKKKRYIWFTIFAVLAALGKEQVWIIIAIFGIAICIFQKRRILGSAIFMSSVGIFYYLIWYAIPQNLGAQHFALSYYSEFGDSPTEIIKTMILSPRKILGKILEPNRMQYINQLFLPLGYLPIVAPLILIFTAPDLAINLLSNNQQLHQIYYQYTSTISPFFFIATIYTISYIKKFNLKIPSTLVIIYLLLAGTYAAYTFGPLPGSKDPNLDMITKPVENRQIIDNYLSHIPKKYSVAASNNVGSHLSERQNIYTLPLGVDKADILVFLLTDSEVGPSLSSEKQQVKRLRLDPNYQLVIDKGSFVVFKKKII
jgi:uncharacterized membrane protein